MPPTKPDTAPDVPNDPGVTDPADPAPVQPADAGDPAGETAASGLTGTPTLTGADDLDGPLLAEAAEPEPTDDELRQLGALLTKAEAANGRVPEQHPDYPRDEFTGEPLPIQTIAQDEWGRSMAPGVQR